MDLELLKSKTLSDLREIAKLAGVKSVTTYKKGELLEILFGLEQEQQAQNPQTAPEPAPLAPEEDDLPMGIFEEEEPGQEEEGRPEPERSALHYEEQEGEETSARRRVVEYVQGNDAVNELLATGECKDAEGVLEVHQGWLWLSAQQQLSARPQRCVCLHGADPQIQPENRR